MKHTIALLLLVATQAQAQIIIEQRTIEVPRNQNFGINPCPASCWAAKKYGNYRDISEVPPHIRAQVDGPQPLRVFSIPQQVIIPTAPTTSPLPGQSAEQRSQMDQMSR